MAGDPHPVYEANVAVDKSAARSHTVIRVGTAALVRATDYGGAWLLYIEDMAGYFRRDTSDTTSPDDDETVIIGPNGERWKKLSNNSLTINAAGTLAERDDFDDETSPFVYYGTDTELAYAKNSDDSADWSVGFSLKGDDGDDGAPSIITGTSTTSLTIEHGSKAFTTEAGRSWFVGQRLRAASDDGTKIMEGPIASYDSGTGALTLTVDYIKGSGTHADWNISVAGEPGQSYAFQLVWDDNNADSDPGDGDIKADNDTLTSATFLYIDDLDRLGNAIATALLVPGAVDNAIKADFSIQVEGGNARIDGVVDLVADDTGYVRYGIDSVSGATGFVAGTKVLLTVRPRSNKGTDGDDGLDGETPGYPFEFEASTSMGEPALGGIRFNHATLSSATAIAISEFTAAAGNPDIASIIASWDDANNGSDRARMLIKKRGAPENFREYRIAAAITDNTDWMQITVVHLGGSGSFSAADSLDVQVTIGGPEGASGSGAVDTVNSISPSSGNVLLEADNINTTSAGTFGGAHIEDVLDDHETRVDQAEADISALESATVGLREKGSDIASAGTISIGDGDYFHVTGTTTITDIDFATPRDGRPAWLIFDGILTLTHHATTLLLPGGANITTAAGDRALVIQDSSDNVYVAAYIRASGRALVAPANMAALDTEDQTLTGGARVTVKDLGNLSGNTITPDPGDRPMQKITNNGAGTIAPGTNIGQYTLFVQNTTGAAVPTTSGWTKVVGAFTNTTTHEFICSCVIAESGMSLLSIQAMQ